MIARHALNYIYNVMMIAGASFLTLLDNGDIFWHLGCYASILFGFMLRMNQIRKKQPLTMSLVCWSIIVTASICWLGVIAWKSYFKGFNDWYQVYLFAVSFFAAVISENIEALGNFTIPQLRRKLARKLYLPDDKEEDVI